MSTPRTATLAALLFPLAAALLTGCGSDFQRLDFRDRTTPPLPVTVTYESIEVPVGVATAVIVKPIAGGEVMDEDTVVSMVSNDTRVLGLDPAIEDRSFVLYGAGPGTTSVTVYIDDERAGQIPVSVTLQHPN